MSYFLSFQDGRHLALFINGHKEYFFTIDENGLLTQDPKL